jgi:hypothetical protein
MSLGLNERGGRKVLHLAVVGWDPVVSIPVPSKQRECRHRPRRSAPLIAAERLAGGDRSRCARLEAAASAYPASPPYSRVDGVVTLSAYGAARQGFRPFG